MNWIEVKKERPEKNKRVLIWTDIGCEIGYFEIGYRFRIPLDGIEIPVFPTHWMTLPDGP